MTSSIDEIQEKHPPTDQEIKENPRVSFRSLVILKALRQWHFENFITPRSVRRNLGLTAKVQKETFEELSQAGLLVHHRVQVYDNRVENWVMVFDKPHNQL